MTLDHIANIVEILGVVAVISAIIFGWIQVLQHRYDTRNAVLIALASSFRDQEFTDAYAFVTTFENSTTLQKIKERAEEYERAALRLGMKSETIALMIYKGYVPLDAF